jgi:hypothetical protein
MFLVILSNGQTVFIDRPQAKYLGDGMSVQFGGDDNDIIVHSPLLVSNDINAVMFADKKVAAKNNNLGGGDDAEV